MGWQPERMFEFAEQASANAPDGSDLAAILVKAHIEYWKYQDMFEEDEKAAAEYASRVDVQNAVVKAYERSLRHYSHVDTMVTVFVRYNLSGWFWITQDKVRLKHELSILGDAIANIHWRWVGTEGKLEDAKSFAK